MARKKGIRDFMPKNDIDQSNEMQGSSIVRSRRDRDGQKNISGWFPDEVHQAIQEIATAKRMNIREVMAMAFNLLFEQENKSIRAE